jgi:hypothetical protein
MIKQNALNFYQNNKDCTWQLETVPEGLTSDLEITDWLLNKSSFGWLELDIDIDLDGWQLEAQQAVPYFVAHREDNNAGWNSCCIHGIDIDKTGAWTNYGYGNEQDVPYDWTELAHKTPTVKQFWQNKFPADKYRRIRFMELEAESAITPHSDMPGRLPGEDNFDALEFGVPVNVAVIHPTDCHLVLEGYGVVPFKQGQAFIINIRNYHSVINFSKQSRIHVIGHAFGYGNKKAEFAKLVADSYRKQYAKQS